MKKFLVINPFGIGDVLFTTPLIRAIKENFPGSMLGYWCNGRVRGLLEANGHIDKIFSISRGDLKKIFQRSKIEGLRSSLKLFRDLRNEKFDVAFDISLDHRYGLVCKLAGIKKRLGFNYKGRGRFLTHKIGLTGYRDKHVVEYYLDLLNFIGVKPNSKKLELFLPDSVSDKVWQTLKELGINKQDLIVAIAPGAGASWGRDAGIKHWPSVNFGQLSQRLQGLGAKIILLGDSSEKTIEEQMLKATSAKIFSFVGKTDILELAALIAASKILITNDGGPLHIAVALNKMTVSFFGPVDPAVYGPYPQDESRHVVLSKTLSCSPCYRDFRLSRCVNNRECLESINPEMAFQAIMKLLKKEAD